MKISILLLLFLVATGTAKEPDLHEVRSLYQAAEETEIACEQLLERLSPFHATTHPTLYAYKASGTLMMAKHVGSPFKKLSYFKDGKEMLQDAIDADPGNPEIRFLRFAIQTNTPKFLGYNDAIEEDKNLLLQHLEQIEDKELKNLIVSFMENSEYLSESEKKQVNSKN